MEETTQKPAKKIAWWPIIAYFAGVIIAFTVGDIILNVNSAEDDFAALYPNTASEDVHVHADFIIYLDGTELDLSDDRYMSASNQILHEDVHLHDNDDTVMHRHAEGITLAEFLGSIGFTLTNECLTTDDDIEYCSNTESELVLFVNGERYESPSQYINEDEDQFLLYYGDPDDTETIARLQSEITEDACIFSLTCPERGTPPPESCGLTCEL